MRWSYKIVHYDYKKEGLLGGAFLDETEIEQSLNEFGQAGWELIALLEVQDGLTATFKQPLDTPVVRQRLQPEPQNEQPEEKAAARFYRPERTVRPPIHQEPEPQRPIRKSVVDEEDERQEEEPPAPSARVPRPVNTMNTRNERRSTPEEGEANGRIGSIRIE